MRNRDGSIKQSGLHTNVDDYSHERIYCPVLGIVLRVFYSDNPLNSSTTNKSDQRGNTCQAEVLVINDGTRVPWTLRNVVILPHGASGVDNYHEEFPKPCTEMLDGSKYRDDLVGINIEKLSGDWCVVQFIGGNIHRPIMTSWFPHPGNRQDPATSALANDVLNQTKRFFKRYQGTKLTITSTGSIYVDTNESGSVVVGSPAGLERLQTSKGGDIQVDVKDSAKLVVDFNKPVKNPGIASLSQPNPPGPTEERETTLSNLYMDSGFVNLVAGQVAKIIGNQFFDSILLGPDADEHAVKGETLRDAFNAFVADYNVTKKVVYTHIHLDGEGSATSSQISGAMDNPGFVSFPTPGTLGPPNKNTNPREVATGVNSNSGDFGNLPESALSKVVKVQ